MLSMHRRYAWYIARHKWFVFIAGLRTRAPLWRLLIHDWSKFLPCEWIAYAVYFYAPKPTSAFVKAERKAAFDYAWLHHQRVNKHHWQYWLLHKDDGETKALSMPEAYVREMVADWMGAGRAITGRWDVVSWYTANAERIVLHPETRRRVRALLGIPSKTVDELYADNLRIVSAVYGYRFSER